MMSVFPYDYPALRTAQGPSEMKFPKYFLSCNILHLLVNFTWDILNRQLTQYFQSGDHFYHIWVTFFRFHLHDNPRK